MKKKTNHYTLMFIPDDNGKTFSLRVHKTIVKSLATFIIVFFVGLFILIYKAGEIATKLQLVYTLQLENDRLSEEHKQLRQVTHKLDKIESFAEYLNRLALPPQIDKQSLPQILSTESGNRKVLVDNDEEYPSFDMETAQKFNAKTVIEPEKYAVSTPNITPVEGWITRHFNQDSTTFSGVHFGVDFAAAFATPIRATAPGIVEDIRTDPYLGLIVTVKHEVGFVTRYGHCSQVLVSIRDRVKRGQTIALVGNTGRSSAPHLHYEVLKDGKNMNPSKYLLTQQPDNK